MCKNLISRCQHTHISNETALSFTAINDNVIVVIEIKYAVSHIENQLRDASSFVSNQCSVFSHVGSEHPTIENIQRTLYNKDGMIVGSRKFYMTLLLHSLGLPRRISSLGFPQSTEILPEHQQRLDLALCRIEQINT